MSFLREAWWKPGIPQFSKRRCCHTDMPSIMIFTQVESRFLAWTSMMNLLTCLQDSKCAPCITSRPRNSDSVPYPLTSNHLKPMSGWHGSDLQLRRGRWFLRLAWPPYVDFFRRCALRQEFENDFELDLVGWPRAGCPVGTRPWKTVRMIWLSMIIQVVVDHVGFRIDFYNLLHTFTILSSWSLCNFEWF